MAKKYTKLSQVLKKLLFEKNMRPIDLARELNMPSPTVHRIVTGKSTRPYKESLEAIARYLDVSVDQLTGEEPLFPQDVSETYNLPINKSTKIVPIIPWQNSQLDFTNPTISEIIVINVSDKAFAVVMPDYSMEPLFPKGATLIFDPTREITDRSFVLVKLHDPNIYVFRQLLIDANQKFIKSLNADISAASIKLLQPQDEIIARLIESRNKL